MLGKRDLVADFILNPRRLLTIVVAKHNGFGVKNSLLAAIGGKSFERTPLINVLNAAALLIPLGLMAWIVTTCAA